jgi:hypothetical protein
MYEWTEIGQSKNFIHESVLEEYNLVITGDSYSLTPEGETGLRDNEVCCLTAQGTEHYYVLRRVVMRSPVVRMLMEREEELVISSITDHQLKVCIEIMCGIEITERQFPKHIVQAFFLDEIPGCWIEEDPSDARLVTLGESLGIYYSSFASYIGTPNELCGYAAHVASVWYTLCREHNYKLYKRCAIGVSDLLLALTDPSFPVAKLSTLCIKVLSHRSCLTLPSLISSVCETTVPYAIVKRVAKVLKEEKNTDVKEAWTKWAFSDEGWRYRERLHANTELIPDKQDLVLLS